jgi:uncharacterized membrane protein YkvA (DUF1232 family)
MTDSSTSTFGRIRGWLRYLRDEIAVLGSLLGDRRTPWHARLFIGLLVAYCLSPIDFIPDFIPVLGYLDELILVPLGVMVARLLVPAALMAEHRAELKATSPWLRSAGMVLVILLWVLVALGVTWLFARWRYGG